MKPRHYIDRERVLAIVEAVQRKEQRDMPVSADAVRALAEVRKRVEELPAMTRAR